MKETDSNQSNDEVIISYLPDKPESTNEKKLNRKLLIALITCLSYLIIIGLFNLELSLVLLVTAIPLMLVVLPLSFVSEHKIIKKKVIQIPLALIVQVLVPTLIVLPFERLYGVITISVFIITSIFLILDFVFVKSLK